MLTIVVFNHETINFCKKKALSWSQNNVKKYESNIFTRDHMLV